MPTIDRPLAAEHALRLDLDQEIFRLSRSEFLPRHGRGAVALVKDGPLRVTLVALTAGGRIAEHRAAGPITVQALYGSIRIKVADEAYTLVPGSLLSIGPGVPHSVESDPGGVFLLTVAA